ncbi:phosphoheptose isomerase [Caldovatus sediminis]|uniref:Phosphoheptose isomerase n=1 Tax=Caldovatus sediminis TaxID=2041189 RepID=A0A8J3EBW5_9PROT|nr:D-sedoheptulose 7-phosphate isomerase [Caldovatus sediminis]GGG41170.1 phosphoheptose isomerase [Caldovatus sediminis]
MSDAASAIARHLAESEALLAGMRADPALAGRIEAAAAACARAIAAGGKVLFCGNGGSAADAQHLAGELVSRFHYDRPGMAGLALTVDSSVLTAIGNDYGYEQVFARQVEALGRAGDVLVGISTSGRSPNVLRAMEAARRRDMTTIGLTGRDGGPMAALCDIELRMPSDSTPLVQQGHIVAGHVICALVEAAVCPRPG